MAETAPKRANPYVGPRAFQPGETLYGRNNETLQLLRLLRSERIVLFYSPSGAGKTSLLQAKLIPMLADAGFQVLPIVRVNLPLPDIQAADELVETPFTFEQKPLNRYVYSIVRTLEDGLVAKQLPDAERTPLARIAQLKLPAYFKSRPTVGEESSKEVLIIDQFEEILTTDPTDIEAKAEFFRQLGEALQEQKRWALITMREDHVPALDPYLRFIPEQFRATFRLDLLGRAAALEAIRRPAQDAGVEFDAKVADTLVDNLRRVQTPVMTAGGGQTLNYRTGPYVEPLHLQVVCLRLWEALPEGATTLPAPAVGKPVEDNAQQTDNTSGAPQTASDGGDRTGTETVDEVLAGYYRAKVKEIAEAHSIAERRVRNWIGSRLILRQGIRNRVVEGDAEQRPFNLTSEVVKALIAAGLVRGENQAGVIWHELTHDRLIDPIRVDNTDWDKGKDNLNLLQRRTIDWIEKDRQPDLLLRGKSLVDMENWAKSNQDELLDDEKEFLQACRIARTTEDRERQSALRTRNLGYLAWGLFIVAFMASFIALKLKMDADNMAKQQLLNKVAVRATVLYQDDPALGLLLATAANHLSSSPDTRQALLAGMTSVDSRITRYLYSDGANIAALALHPQKPILASAWDDGKVILWNIETFQRLQVLDSHKNAIYRLAFTADGKLLSAVTANFSAGQNNNNVSVPCLVRWQADRNYSEMPPLLLNELNTRSSIPSVVFSPDGRQVAYASQNYIRICDVTNGKELALLKTAIAFQATSMAFSVDNQRFALGTLEGSVLIWRLANPENPTHTITPAVPDKKNFPVVGLIFSSNSSQMCYAVYDPISDMNSIFSWSMVNNMVSYTHSSSGSVSGQFIEMSPGPDESVFAGTSDGIALLKAPTFTPEGEPLHEATSGMTTFCLDHSGKTLVTGRNHALAIWDLSRRQRLTQNIFKSTKNTKVDSMAYSADGKRLAWINSSTEPDSVTPDNIILWSADPRRLDRIKITGDAYSIAFDPLNNNDLLLSGVFGSLWIWDINQGKSLAIAPKSTNESYGPLTFSSDGVLLACGSNQGTVTLWGRPLLKLQLDYFPSEGNKNNILSLAFSKDGKTLISVDDAGIVRVGRLQANRATSKFPTQNSPNYISAAALGDAGTRLALYNGRQIELWNVADHRRIRTFGDKQAITALAFSPDAVMLASGDKDGGLLLWDVETQRKMTPLLKEHKGGLFNIVFRPDGKQMASWGTDGQVLLWDLDPQSWERNALQIANRNFSRAEWKQYFEEVPYQPLNPQLPIPP